ncbi:MAG: ribonuclease HI [Gammaproteobacteria bacterium]|nr:ribonuclease HI [Gammaproteobacteria bacterium]MYD76775.1 ribonuclease HI [Gammaproteobacteria bacterium]MYJ51887.1 ribonuclease HI [Gammaproteobacteria bacterium]
MHRVVIYTDGACKGNPGPGGWGVLLQSGGHEKELMGGEPHTTNNRMELTATIEALRALKGKSEVDIYTDSSYLKNGIERWIRTWRRNNWLTAGRQPVKNRDLWEALDTESSRHSIRWHWVRGHAGNPGNERADRLAKTGMREFF